MQNKTPPDRRGGGGGGRRGKRKRRHNLRGGGGGGGGGGGVRIRIRKRLHNLTGELFSPISHYTADRCSLVSRYNRVSQQDSVHPFLLSEIFWE